MNERLKSILLGALGFGIVFLLFEILLTLPFDILFRFLTRITPALGFLTGWIFYLMTSLSIGVLGGKIFAYGQPSQAEVIRAGKISIGILGGLFLPLIVGISSTLDFFAWYAAENETESLITSILDEKPPPLSGALVGILVGGVIAMVFGLILDKARGWERKIKTIFMGTMAFGLGGYLMALMAPLNIYFGRLQPVVWFEGNGLLLLPVRLFGVSLFGVLGGATLAYFLEPESKKN